MRKATTRRFAVANASSLPAHLIEPMVEAVQRQITEHVGPAWGRTTEEVVFRRDVSLLEPGDSPIVLFDGGEEADALGWHRSDPHGRPFGRVFVRPILAAGGVVLHDVHGSVSVASVVSHEVGEALIDEDCNIWVDGPATAYGCSYALEIGDPVQSQVYTIKTRAGQPVSVANFVYPSWFDERTPAGTQIDHLWSLRRPFTLAPGGHTLIRWYKGDEKTMWGPSPPPAWKTRSLRHPAARTSRRMEGMRGRV